MSVLDTLKAATPSRRTVTVCLDSALQGEWDALVDQLQDAAKKDAASMAKENTGALVDQLDEIRERMAASEVTFVFQQISWSKRVALQADNPPRDKNVVDRINGFNLETYYPALVRACCVEVQGADGDAVTEIPDEVWDSLLGNDGVGGSLNTGQFNTLIRTATAVNDGETSVPPSARSLLGSQDSGASLESPNPGASLPSGSADGNPPGSPKSSTTPKASTKARSVAT